MQISLHAFWTPKRGNTGAEYEDAFWPSKSFDLTAEFLRFAVADGATETSFAGAWAQLLTRAFCRDQFSGRKIEKTLPRLEKEWRTSIGEHSLPWYAEQKLAHGAYATLLGLTILEGTWEAVAIGDSCLFHVRDGRLITSFPLTSSAEFGNRPPLLSSNSRNWQEELSHICRIQGTWQSGDIFYLMTDAIACWFLRVLEQEATMLDPAPEAESFENWIDRLRNAGMRNDDVTVLRIRVI